MHDSPPRHHDNDHDFGHDGHDFHDFRSGRDGHDDHDDLAALDFSPPPDSGDTTLDALDEYGGYVAPASDSDAGDGEYPDDPQDVDDDEVDDGPVVPLFTVTNPPGTVAVTTFVDGRVRDIQLSPKVNTLSEVSLAEEIMVIARLAIQDARAGQFSFMLEGLRLQGHDGVATRDFLQRDLDLPTPEQVAEDRAAVFEQRYAGRHE